MLTLALMTFAATGFEKSDALDASDAMAEEGRYVVPGEWRQPITQDDIAAFSETYGPSSERQSLRSRSGETIFDGYAVEMIEAGANYDKAGRQATGYEIESRTFTVAVPATEQWSEEQIQDLYSAVTSEVAMARQQYPGKDIGSINLVGPLGAGNERYMTGEVQTYQLEPESEPEAVTFSWDEQPRAGCTTNNATRFRVNQAFTNRAQADLNSRKCHPDDHVYTYDHVITISGANTPPNSAGTYYYLITGFPTYASSAGNYAARGKYHTHYDLYKNQLCFSEAKVVNYGYDMHTMGKIQGGYIFGTPPVITIENERYLPTTTQMMYEPVNLVSGANFWRTTLTVGRVGILTSASSNCP